MKFTYINFLMFVFPGAYLIFYFSNAEELTCGLIMLFGGMWLNYLDKNKHRPEVMDFIRKYI